MKTETIFILIAVACALVAFAGMQHPVISGIAKAFVGVALIAFFITKFFVDQKA